MDTEEIFNDKFNARMEAQNVAIQTWLAHRVNARAKLIDLGLTAEETDSILDGPQWATGETEE